MLILNRENFDIAVPDGGAGAFGLGLVYQRNKSGWWLGLLLGPLLLSVRVWAIRTQQEPPRA